MRTVRSSRGFWRRIATTIFLWRFGFILLAISYAWVSNASLAFAATGSGYSSEQLYEIQTGTGHYDPQASSACASTADATGGGTLPSYIPDPWNTAFSEGGEKHDVSPALVAAIFTEENFTGIATSGLSGRWGENPLFDHGPDSGWPTSSAGATGPFQFLPSTWTHLGYNLSDIDNLDTAADAAADYLAKGGATLKEPPSTWSSAIFQYNHADWYVSAVMTYYNYYNSDGTDSSSSATPIAEVTSADCGVAASGECATAPKDNLPQLRADLVACAQDQLSLWKAGTMYPGFRANNSNSFSKYTYNANNLWCAWFVSWIYKQVGYPLDYTGSNGVVSYVPNLVTMAKDDSSNPNGKFVWHAYGSYTPQAGDIGIFLDENHTGLVINSSEEIGGDQEGGGSADTNVVSETPLNAFQGTIVGWVSPTGKQEVIE